VHRIGKITTAGVITEYSSGITVGATPFFLAAGPDGNVWFTEEGSGSHTIGKITPAGVVTEYSRRITTDANPAGITAGPDGNVWFTERDSDRIARIRLRRQK